MIKKCFITLLLLAQFSCASFKPLTNPDQNIDPKVVVIISQLGIDRIDGEVVKMDNCLLYKVSQKQVLIRKMLCDAPYKIIIFENEKDFKKFRTINL